MWKIISWRIYCREPGEWIPRAVFVVSWDLPSRFTTFDLTREFFQFNINIRYKIIHSKFKAADPYKQRGGNNPFRDSAFSQIFSGIWGIAGKKFGFREYRHIRLYHIFSGIRDLPYVNSGIWDLIRNLILWNKVGISETAGNFIGISGFTQKVFGIMGLVTPAPRCPLDEYILEACLTEPPERDDAPGCVSRVAGGAVHRLHVEHHAVSRLSIQTMTGKEMMKHVGRVVTHWSENIRDKWTPASH